LKNWSCSMFLTTGGENTCWKWTTSRRNRLRAYGQRDPVVEYKHEAYSLFKSLMEEMKLDIVKLLFNAKVVVKGPEETEKGYSCKGCKNKRSFGYNIKR